MLQANTTNNPLEQPVSSCLRTWCWLVDENGQRDSDLDSLALTAVVNCGACDNSCKNVGTTVVLIPKIVSAHLFVRLLPVITTVDSSKTIALVEL
ncbi:unnamed protein product [Ceratitis capitata]|uniref:(Mediterranean fruit fly) hypothetical protein n=1 Tax=Ceratitis capitata TaxID=7213 RepID=A0A811UNE2_CERCA|nr:unnamed protein product [Ceratitis capitata]